MPYSVRNGLRIHYQSVGEGPALVLVHANPFDHRLWLYQVARYSQFYKVVSVDLRGYGRSDKPETPFTLHDMAQDVVGVCQDEEIKHAVFFGVSVGSGIAMLLALESPELLRAMVLVGGSSRGSAGMPKRIEGFLSPDYRAYQERHLRDCVSKDFADSERGRWILNMFSEGSDRLSGRCIAQIFRARLGCDMQSRLSGVRTPTLVINGEYDQSLASGRETSMRIPGARHAILRGAGHACNIEVPEAFDAEATAFLVENGLWRGPAQSGAAASV